MNVDFSKRDKLILAGLYLSKYDLIGAKRLGFESFAEAFNAIGYALGAKPASLKNYRDEFDPLFPNERKGWHRRKTREYCLEVLRQYGHLDFDSFTGLISSFAGVGGPPYDAGVDDDSSNPSFAQRIITGLAAEQYFESIHTEIPEFEGYVLENTTRYGCGYDFRLSAIENGRDFLAVEVKGIKGRTGSLLMTPKEYDVACKLKSRFFLVVVSNFTVSPSYRTFRDPISSSLQFIKMERVTVQTSWLATV